MPNAKSKLGWCLSNENRLKKISSNIKKASEHIDKAKHNLLAADYNVKGGFSDWQFHSVITPCIIRCLPFCIKMATNQRTTNAQLVP